MKSNPIGYLSLSHNMHDNSTEFTASGWRTHGETGGDDREFVVVSNRQPYRHTSGESGIEVDRPVGGLAMGLDSVMRRLGGTWIAWGDGDADRQVVDQEGRVEVPPETGDYTLSRVWLSEEEVENYYYGFSNQVLWPVCHGLPGNVRTESAFWREYRSVNERFAAEVVEEVSGRATIWFQDYHFALAPSIVRDRLSTPARIMSFWHIPWPSWNSFRVCPYDDEVLRGMLGNDVLGFHVPRYATNFLGCVESGLDGARVDWEERVAHFDGRTTEVEAIPMGVPVDELTRFATTPTAREYPTAFRANHGIDDATRLVVGVDRLDYTKGIPQRLDAIEHLFEVEPDWRGEFTYVQNASESRSGIPEYDAVQDRVPERVAEINDRFGTEEWTPIVYTTEWIPREELMGLYKEADAAIVSPIRDGLNLVAQEYAGAQTDDEGMLILSETAGIHDLIGDAALSINPYETERFAHTIAEALTMGPDRRRRRMAAIRRTLAENDRTAWMDHFLRSPRDATRVRRAQR